MQHTTTTTTAAVPAAPASFHDRLLTIRDTLRDRAQGAPDLAAALAEAEAAVLDFELELFEDEHAATASFNF